MGLRESVERGLLAPGSCALEQIQHGVISLSAVPGLSMRGCILEPPSERAVGALMMLREGRHGCIAQHKEAHLRPLRQDPAPGSLQLGTFESRRPGKSPAWPPDGRLYLRDGDASA